jgi:hypothetical protein
MASILHICCRKLALATLETPLVRFSTTQHFALRTSRMPSWQPHPPARNGNRRFLTTNKNSGTSKQAKETANEQGLKYTFSQSWQRFTGARSMPERWTLPWYREMVLISTVFAITGSSTMVVVRPAVSNVLGLKGSLKDGPWSYRICSLVIMTPIYATLLVLVGTVFGRHHYFRHFSVKMWSRFGIPPEMLDQSFHETKKHFRKW